MKKIILLVLICVLAQSCNSQKKDLSQITFSEKYDNFFGDIPNQFDLSVDAKTYKGYYKSESDHILNFNGINLSDYKNEKGGFGTNYIAFAFTKKDHTLCNYYISLYTKKSTNKLIDALKNKFGKPKYVDKLDMTDVLPDSYLWQDKQIIYLLRGTTQNTATLTVFRTEYEELYNSKLSGPFMYYKDYLSYLKKHQKTEKQISYYQYAKIEESDGTDYYINSYVKP